MEVQSTAQSCSTPFHPVDCRPPGSSVNGIFQTTIQEHVAISYSRGSSWSRDQTHICCISCIGRWIFFTTSPLNKPFMLLINVKNLTQTTSMITGNSHLRRWMYTAEIPHLVSIYSVNAQIAPSPLLVLRRWQWAPCIHSLISQFPFTEWMMDNTQAHTMCWGILINQER